MGYLSVYNAVSGLLWAIVLGRAIVLYALAGPEFVAEGMADFTSWVQLLAALEVVHAMLGLVRSSVLTTAMQVASRLVIIWGVVRLFPSSAENAAFPITVIAWGITETIRYPYYWAAINGGVPKWLEWLRYNTFIFLYPIGASGEAYMAYKSLAAAQHWHPTYALFLKVLLMIYPPSFYVLYMHMWKQRSKVLGKKKTA